MGLGNLDFLEQAPVEFLVQHEVYQITRLLKAMEEASRLNNRPAEGLRSSLSRAKNIQTHEKSSRTAHFSTEIMGLTVVTDLGDLSRTP